MYSFCVPQTLKRLIKNIDEGKFYVCSRRGICSKLLGQRPVYQRLFLSGRKLTI